MAVDLLNTAAECHAKYVEPAKRRRGIVDHAPARTIREMKTKPSRDDVGRRARLSP
jgi:hypothetical protein